MCAIIGIASSNPTHNQDWIIDGRDSMIHRGPDDKGEWHSSDYRVRFAHRRLSIIDKSSAGHQPMKNLAGNVIVVFNGEIYNFRDLKKELALAGHIFNTHSDTEVLIAAWVEWGVDCVKHLTGMFAFAIHDSKENTIFLARDRAGEKPLFYSYKEEELRFSSELKGLLCDSQFSKSLNHKALNLYLEIGYIPGELCILEGVNKLPPASALLFKYRLNEIKKWTYWSPPELNSGSFLGGGSHNQLLDEFDTLLENSVRQQLYADVPVGILLSGGLDSSLITAMASRSADQVNTFTVNFTGHEKYNESSHANLISQYFNTQHTEIECGEISPELLFKLAHQFDEPICDSSMLPTYLLSQKVKDYCKVALGGDGGDELFGGYTYYNRLLYLHKISRWMPTTLRKILSKSSTSMLPMGFRGKYFLQSMSMDLDKKLPLIGSFFESEDRAKLLGEQMTFENVSVKEEAIEILDIVQRATRSDFKNFLVEDVLVKIDRSSMLNSLEVRAPFLDRNIIDFAFEKVPTSLKVTTNDRKILIKKFARRVLPENFDFERKQGFSVPLEYWMKSGPWRDILNDTLLSQQCLFDKRFIRNMIKSLDSGRNNSERLFCLLLFELWKNEYSVS